MRAAVFLAAAAAGTSGTSSSPLPAAKAVVERLQKGEQYMGNDGETFLADGKLHGPSIALLVETLKKTQDNDPRNELAHLLVGAARVHDKERAVILDSAIVAALVEVATAKQDPAKEVCLDALIKNTPATLLAPHGEALAKDLAAHPDETTALAVAKAKPKNGLAALESAIKIYKDHGKTNAARLLRIAMGDAKLEKALLDSFAAEKDGEKKRTLARELALAGTPATLKALGGEMRSPLVYETPSSLKRSFRLDVMEALLLAYPEEIAFYPNRLRDDAGYVAAEAAAEKRTGAKLTAPRPEFLTSVGKPF